MLFFVVFSTAIQLMTGVVEGVPSNLTEEAINIINQAINQAAARNNRDPQYPPPLVGVHLGGLGNSTLGGYDQSIRQGINAGSCGQRGSGPAIVSRSPEPEEPREQRQVFVCQQEEPVRQTHIIEREPLERNILPTWPVPIAPTNLRKAYPKIFHGQYPWQVNQNECYYTQVRYEMPIFSDNMYFDWAGNIRILQLPYHERQHRPNPGPIRAIYVRRVTGDNVLCDVVIHPFQDGYNCFRQCKLRLVPRN
ncbi:hypothetical protein F4779DRAFT_616960 [Xylariaceae sp. FL0662B]|nr:hypothetical protein F4779DRAFT_616960 [Xylariaceae sp. FL0662B]